MDQLRPFSGQDREMDLSGATVLLTGGTGSFGHAFVERVMAEWPDAVVRVYSRDELKQSEMRARYGERQLRFLVGDVRDRSRMTRAVQGADVVVHAAAMKQVPACEYNPFEAVRTNVLGAQHVVDAAIDADVSKVLALSTDKAVNPVNLYGATKLCAEKIFVQGNAYAAQSPTRLACVRYGGSMHVGRAVHLPGCRWLPHSRRERGDPDGAVVHASRVAERRHAALAHALGQRRRRS